LCAVLLRLYAVYADECESFHHAGGERCARCGQHRRFCKIYSSIAQAQALDSDISSVDGLSFSLTHTIPLPLTLSLYLLSVQEVEAQQEEVSRLEEDRSRLHRLLESQSEDARSVQAQALEHEEALAQQMAWVRERERDMKRHLSEALDEQQRLRDLVGERERDAQQRLSEAVEEQQRLCGVIAEGDRAREAGQAEVESLKARQSASEQVLEEVCGRMAAAVAVLEQDLVELQTSLVAIFQDLKEQERSMEEEWEARLSSSVGAKEREKQAAAEELSSYVDMLSSSLVVAAAEFEVQAHSASAEAAALDRLDGVVCAILESLGVTYAALEHRATAQAQHAAAAASQESARSSADMAFGRHLQAIDDSVGLLEERLRLAADVGLEQAQMLNDGRHSRDGMLEEVTRSWLEASEALEHVLYGSKSSSCTQH